MLSEMSDKERQIPYDITYVESKKQTSEYNKKRNRLRDIENKLVFTGGGKEGGVTWVEKRSGKFFLKRCQGLKFEDLDI